MWRARERRERRTPAQSLAGTSVDGNTGENGGRGAGLQRKVINSFSDELNMRLLWSIWVELSISKLSEYVWCSENRPGLKM